eukprot:Hpha_TRINITY_DN16136_c6_g5::TRINITY_DN16136_c6_g5_i1::g.3404::m.3404
MEAAAVAGALAAAAAAEQPRESGRKVVPGSVWYTHMQVSDHKVAPITIHAGPWLGSGQRGELLEWLKEVPDLAENVGAGRKDLRKVKTELRRTTLGGTPFDIRLSYSAAPRHELLQPSLSTPGMGDDTGYRARVGRLTRYSSTTNQIIVFVAYPLTDLTPAAAPKRRRVASTANILTY